MSFRFEVSGTAGEGMAGNSQEEIDAFRLLIQEVLESAHSANLNATIHNISPKAWLESDKPLDTFSLGS